MIQMNLKRKYENNSCTHGILTIPAYQFKCLTLELCNGNKMRCKQDCRINEGSYLLERGYAQGWPSFPVFKKKPSGFVRRPEFNLSADNYMNLPTGDIALGTEMLDGFSIRHSDELAEVFKAIFQDAFCKKETVVLCVYQSAAFRYEDVTYSQLQGKIFHFIKDDI